MDSSGCHLTFLCYSCSNQNYEQQFEAYLLNKMSLLWSVFLTGDIDNMPAIFSHTPHAQLQAQVDARGHPAGKKLGRKGAGALVVIKLNGSQQETLDGQWHPGLYLAKYWHHGKGGDQSFPSAQHQCGLTCRAVFSAGLLSALDWKKSNQGPQEWREWSISSMRKDGKSWDCSAGRKEGSEGSHQYLQITEGKLQRGWSQDLLSGIQCQDQRCNENKLRHRRFSLNIRKRFSHVRVTRHYYRLSRDTVESPFAKIFKRCHVAKFCQGGWTRSFSKIPSNLNRSVILGNTMEINIWTSFQNFFMAKKGGHCMKLHIKILQNSSPFDIYETEAF